MSDLEMFKEFLRGEDEYMKKLERLVENYLPSISTEIIIDAFEVFGRIDLILIYHRCQFIVDIYNVTSVDDIVEHFIKHRHMFYMYKDLKKAEPYLVWLTQEFENLSFVKRMAGSSSNNIIEQRFREYLMFLNKVKVADKCHPQRCEVAIQIIQDVLAQESDIACQQKVRLGEFLLSEKKYNINLKKNLELYEEIVFSKTNKYNWIKSGLYGKLPEIYQKQTKFFLELDNCRYDLDMDEFIECFLKNLSMFELYKEDRKLRSRKLRDKCAKEYKDFSNIKDVIFDRLFKYPQFFQGFEKCFKDDKTFDKIKDVQNFFGRLMSEINDVVAVNEITDANIDVYAQGNLLLRGDMKVSHGIGDATLFLFEKALVFTKLYRKDKLEYYVYKDHVLTSNIKPGKEGELIHYKTMTPSIYYSLIGANVYQWNKALEDLIFGQAQEYKST